MEILDWHAPQSESQGPEKENKIDHNLALTKVPTRLTQKCTETYHIAQSKP